jgi:hypothetical protein
LIGLFMAAFVFARERIAMAEGPPVEAPARHVEIKLVAKEEDRALVAVLTELLDRLQVTTHFSTVSDLETEEMWNHPGATPAVARAWIDLRERGQVTLYLTGDQQDRVLVRQVPLVQNLDEVAREEIAHIVEAAVDELLLGGQIGVEKKPGTEQPATVSLPPPLPEPPWRLDIGFGYSAQMWTSGPPLHGPAGFASFIKNTGAFRPGAWASVEIRFPYTIDKEIPEGSVSMILNQVAVRLLFAGDTNLSTHWRLRGGIGGGFDWVRVAPKVEATQVTPYETTQVYPMLRATGLARYAVASKSELFFGLALDFDLHATKYFVDIYDPNLNTTSRRLIFDPWLLQPMALFGITADVLAY